MKEDDILSSKGLTRDSDAFEVALSDNASLLHDNGDYYSLRWREVHRLRYLQLRQERRSTKSSRKE